jgi:endo-1,4-beta-xylanase
VTAGAAALTGWTVAVTLPSGAAVTSTWNAQATGSSGAVSFANSGYNGSLAAGAATEFGFQGTGVGPSTTPSCTAR